MSSPSLAWRLALDSVPTAGAERSRLALPLARAVGLTPSLARLLLESTGVLPCDLEETAAKRLAERVSGAGVACHLIQVPHSDTSCTLHPTLRDDGPCDVCREPRCLLCRRLTGNDTCPECVARARQRRRNRNVRVAVLMSFLLGTLGWATTVQRRQRARTDWERPLDVRVVLISRQALSRETVQAARESVVKVERFLAQELRRYRPQASITPAMFTVEGPLSVEALPYSPAGAEPGLWTRWQLVRRLHRLAEQAHPGASGIDATLFVALEEGPRWVEGLGAAGGDVGWVHTAPEEVDSALAQEALAHEFLHLVGAQDHYGADGHPEAPGGLAEPARVPLYPQRFAEVMAEEIATAPGAGRVPGSLEEVRVGPQTAREVRWTAP